MENLTILKQKGENTARRVAKDTVSVGDSSIAVRVKFRGLHPGDDDTEEYVGTVSRAVHEPVQGNRMVVLTIRTDEGEKVSVLSGGNVTTPRGEGELVHVTR